MICRRRPGLLDIRSISGAANYEVNFEDETTIVSAALDEAGERLAVVLGREWAMDQGYAEEPLVLIDLTSGARHVIHEGRAAGPLWFPGEDRIAFSSGTAICVADLSTGSVEEVYRFATETQGPTDICLRPDGMGLAFLKHVGDDRRIGVVDLATGEGRVHAVSCFSYCWWDAETILYVLGSGLKLLDIRSGKSRTLLRDLTALDKSGALAALGEKWLQAVRMEGATQDLRGVLCLGDRVHFGCVAVFAVTRRTILPFIRQTHCDSVRGVLSMARDRTDLRLHFDQEPAGFGIVPINSSQTLAVHVTRRSKEGWLEQDWVFVGEGAESIPDGFGPLPKASFGLRGDASVGGFPQVD